MNIKNILEQVKQKYADLLITDPDEAKRTSSWISGSSLDNSVLGELNKTQILPA